MRGLLVQVLSCILEWNMPQRDREPSLLSRERSYDERFYQPYKYGQLFSDQIVSLSQVRREKNIVKADLRADILSGHGLLNGLDVAIVDSALLCDYLEFVRNTWGDAAEYTDFDEQRRQDGTYPLLMAGHSRHQAIVDNERDGLCPQYPIPVKFHDVHFVWDIIKIQLGENLHSQPPRERQAIALVEAYRYGQSQGMWQSVDEFMAADEIETTPSFMKQAMLFEQLPAEIRSYVLSGPIHFTVGVEMAKSVKVLEQLLRTKYGDDLDSDLLTELVLQEFVILCNAIQKGSQHGGSLNSTAAKARVGAQRRHWQEQTAALTGSKNAATFDFEFVSPAQQAHELSRKNLETIRRQLAELSQVRGDQVERIIILAGNLVGESYVQECLDKQIGDAERAVERGKMKLCGRGAAGVTAASRELELADLLQ